MSKLYLVLHSLDIFQVFTEAKHALFVSRSCSCKCKVQLLKAPTVTE